MINVVIYRNEKDGYAGFCVTGHAGFAENGYDIVCSAVSMLVINTVNSIESLTNAKSSIKSDDKKGLIELKLITDDNKDAELLIKSLVLGLESVKEQYTNNIRISEERAGIA
jgi:uncharacterized protein YsxB (DUF464 family)